MRAFVDTNVLVYLFDSEDAAKQRRARELISELAKGHALALSAQVLSEFYVTVTRKLAVPLSPVDAASALEALSVFPVVAVDGGLVRRAAARADREQLSYWDALILEAAVESGADVLLSEDLQAGDAYRDMRVENPFVTPAA